MTPMQMVRARLLLRSPFYGAMLLMTPLIETREIPTAATDMNAIYWNPDFFAKLNINEAMFVLAHEVMHIILLHGARRNGRPMERWNDAADYAINPILVANAFTMPAPPNHGLLDKQYEGMGAEEIYNRLPRQPPRGGRGALAGDLRPAKAGVADDVRSRVVRAATAARLAGRIPVGMEKIIQSIMHPQVPWQELLRHYMTQRSNTRMDWGRRNRRFTTVYLPVRRGKRMGGVGIINDASGSINQRTIDLFAAEMQAIAVETGAAEIRVKHADTKTQAEQCFKAGEQIILRPRGGGGTDMRVPLAEFEKDAENIECVVMLTDGHTPWPTAEPCVPLIVCCTTDVSVPVGTVVRLNT